MKQAYMTAFVILSLSPAAFAFDSNEVPRETSLQRAIIEPAMVQQAIELENRISAQADTAAPSGESPVVVSRAAARSSSPLPTPRNLSERASIGSPMAPALQHWRKC
ncbi:hypothetical protein [Pseudomonas bharatica]|uniref:hypothetical protein n=1 Tax=Pseudomonas bharatica TaxID=2692112 RepID=UPI003B27CD77